MGTLTPDGKKIHLKYLFRAIFADGSELVQDQNDESTLVPGKSAFFDVLDKIENGTPLVYFQLFSNDEGVDNTFGIRLDEGTFYVNDVPFKLHERDLENFRVIYFVVRDNHFKFSGEYIGHEEFYRIGFQANEKNTGRNEEHWLHIS